MNEVHVETSDKLSCLCEMLKSMSTCSTEDDLTKAYSDLMKECVGYYTLLKDNLAAQNEEVNETADEMETIEEATVEAVDAPNLSESNVNEEITAETSGAVCEANSDVPDTATHVATEDDTPVYAVFYSVNNAAYVAVNERMRVCVPVRNLAKAYCVKADTISIAQGQNELSRYKLDKLKPIQIKFLNQKEYDDTIGRAVAMQALIANMPTSSNTTISSGHKVNNFASGNKGSSGGHIGEKPKSDYDNSSWSGSYKKDGGYDYFHSKPYGGSMSGGSSYKAPQSTASTNKSFKVTMRDAMESPKELYKLMHNGLDDQDVYAMPVSYMNDLIQLTQADYQQIDDFQVLIPLINEAIDAITSTKAGWVVGAFLGSGRQIDNDYMMDIDYSMLDKAIEDWNRRNDPCQIAYVEEFDPTILAFKKNIEEVANKTCADVCELAAMAIYNYVRCLMAYDSYYGYKA